MIVPTLKSTENKKIILAVGARPNFMKAAPVWEKLKNSSHFNLLLIHTGQHYDPEMSGSFIQDLGLPQPDVHLEVGSGTHARQTGKIMSAFEEICFKQKPHLVMVVGDVNSTLACALVAAKLCIPTAHIEAGLRSFDRSMPEEINRILTDQVSDYLFTTCEDANQNLLREGIPEDRIHFVGNVMIDSLLKFRDRARKSKILSNLGLKEDKEKKEVKDYAVVTLHRPSNVDDPQIFKSILHALKQISLKIPVIFPIHPRTLKQIKKLGLEKSVYSEYEYFSKSFNLQSQPFLVIKPLGYVDFLCLMSEASVVLTDSGGIQEETTILGIPCLTLRENTERPVTIREGTNRLVGNNPDKIIQGVEEVLARGVSRNRIPRYWDGKAAHRIVKIIQNSNVKI